MIIYQKTAVKNIIPKQTLIKNNLSFLASKKMQHFPLIFYVKTQKNEFFQGAKKFVFKCVLQQYELSSYTCFITTFCEGHLYIKSKPILEEKSIKNPLICN